MIILTFPFNQIQMLNPTAGSGFLYARALDFYMSFFDPNKVHTHTLLSSAILLANTGMNIPTFSQKMSSILPIRYLYRWISKMGTYSAQLM